LADSFFHGLALLVTPSTEGDDIWNVIKIIYIDTKNDKNMNIDFGHSFFLLEAVLIQSTSVSGFLPSIKKIKRKFDPDTCLESWEVI
jgi:hypothetical protein